jgi:hypothetical protein
MRSFLLKILLSQLYSLIEFFLNHIILWNNVNQMVAFSAVTHAFPLTPSFSHPGYGIKELKSLE